LTTIPLSTAPSLIALDWGTTSLRAYQLGSVGEVLQTRTEPWGVMHVTPGDFPRVFDAMTSEWRKRWPDLNVIAAGMVGSSAGWTDLPYSPCPVGVEELADSVASVENGIVHIVPGVAIFGDTPNMMRGEETEIVGVLELHPELAEESLLVLPGTHSKWVRVSRGRIVDFSTCITGELFALLRDHSILGRAARDTTHVPDRATVEAAFARGVLAARGATAGIAPLLFSARAMVLARRVEPEASLEYLSGLLIGDEIRAGLSGGARPSALVGDPVLCARYVAALRLFGAPQLPVYEGTAAYGLWEIARRAGLLAAPS
jgi:2-dehydro-3-deoxygalactonokinase